MVGNVVSVITGSIHLLIDHRSAPVLILLSGHTPLPCQFLYSFLVHVTPPPHSLPGFLLILVLFAPTLSQMGFSPSFQGCHHLSVLWG